MTIDLNALSKTSYAIATEKGWWTGPERGISALTVLMQSEISEAIEEYRVGKGFNEVWLEKGVKPCGIPIELADVIIRVCDLAGHRGYKLEALPEEVPVTDFEEGLARASYYISKAWYREEAAKHPTWVQDFVPVEFYLSKVCAVILALCETYKIDIEPAVGQKEEYNKTRPFKHGGKII
jgi:hypothetical protein